jgi:hypothetical protein
VVTTVCMSRLKDSTSSNRMFISLALSGLQVWLTERPAQVRPLGSSGLETTTARVSPPGPTAPAPTHLPAAAVLCHGAAWRNRKRTNGRSGSPQPTRACRLGHVPSQAVWVWRCWRRSAHTDTPSSVVLDGGGLQPPGTAAAGRHVGTLGVLFQLLNT